jgi:hypothetical protein
MTRVERLSGEPRYVVAGGSGPGASSYEVLVPGAGAVWVRGALQVPRAEHSATVLPDGTVLLVGGVNPETGAPLTSTEIIDPLRPEDGTVLAEPLAIKVVEHRAMAALFLGHAFEEPCGGRKFRRAGLGEALVDAAVLFLVGDGQRQNLALREFGDAFARGKHRQEPHRDTSFPGL